MMRRPHWHAIQMPLALLLAMGLIAGAGVMWSSARLREAGDGLQRQRQALDTASQRSQRSNREQDLIRNNLGAYRSLVARGFAGAENRLAWLEAVQQANREARLYGLDYSMEPRQAAPAPLAAGLPLGQTVMKLKMPLLVEDDLPRFLEVLRQRAPGLFRVRSCRIARTASAAFEPVNQPRLEAECELLWFTVAIQEANRP